MAKKNGHFVSPYRHYRFKDYDPVLDKVNLIIQQSNQSVSAVSKESASSSTTLYNWRNHRVRMPRHTTMAGVLGALGYEFTITRKR